VAGHAARLVDYEEPIHLNNCSRPDCGKQTGR
jgi:hypothetical protein